MLGKDLKQDASCSKHVLELLRPSSVHASPLLFLCSNWLHSRSASALLERNLSWFPHLESQRQAPARRLGAVKMTRTSGQLCPNESSLMSLTLQAIYLLKNVGALHMVWKNWKNTCKESFQLQADFQRLLGHQGYPNCSAYSLVILS